MSVLVPSHSLEGPNRTRGPCLNPHVEIPQRNEGRVTSKLIISKFYDFLLGEVNR